MDRLKRPAHSPSSLHGGALALLALSCAASPPVVPPGARAAAGPGFYATQRLPGEQPPRGPGGRPALPKVTADFAQMPVTHDWWSSLIWQGAGDPYSAPMFPHPLSARAVAGGLELGYPTVPRVEERSYFYPHQADLTVGVAGLAAPDTRVAGYGDFSVTAAWDDGRDHALRLTFGHGLPFVYATGVHGRARVALAAGPGGAAPEIWLRRGNLAGVTVAGHHYLLFAPAGSAWELLGDALEADLGGRDYFSVAVLPARDEATVELFRRHAFAFVRDTQVTWRYDRTHATMTTRFSAAIDVREGDAHATPLYALYRHQWLHARAPVPDGPGYVSPRGTMKLVAGPGFEVELPAQGPLPALPTLTDAGGCDPSLLDGLLKIAARAQPFPPGLEGTRDSFWEGKSFGRTAALIPIADALGEESLRRDLVAAIERELEDWFDGQPPRRFVYDATWKTLVGSPAMYGSDTELNDHHFHNGYFVFAAATVARYDRAWAERWAPAIELLIRDAGSWRHDDPLFPFARHFDPYAGHSWASGTTSPFLDGNNEESSSEELSFAAGVALWGEEMARPEIRDFGLWLYATATDAVAQYWYDVDRQVFPPGFPHAAIGIVWGSGGVHGTWFNQQPAFIHGIQLTPMFPFALWLGRRPDAVARTLDEVRRENGGPLHLWRDLFWMLEALADPAAARAAFDGEHRFEPEWGNSLAYTYRFIGALTELGQIDPSVRADSPLYAVFRRPADGARSYAAYNASDHARQVHFSDGRTVTVPPHRLLTTR
ncbi:MAG TPA: glycosyl hydrolase [Polyangia bacterium]|nr:glycosyl hydrolase [Polyangia bacterium]